MREVTPTTSLRPFDTNAYMVYNVRMTETIKKRNWGIYHWGDVVRCTSAIKGSKGKRYKFTGAVFSPDDLENPLYLDLIEQGRGQFRCVKPQFVVKDVEKSKEAQARILAKETK